MLKISGGQWRGRTLASKTAGADLRPTTGLVRQAWFNRVQFQLNGSHFLDLFSGTGLMGLEALSRGAKFVCAVEQDRQHAAGIRQNYERFGVSKAQCQIIQKDAEIWVKATPEAYDLQAFDLIYMDPPYAYPYYGEILTALLQNGWMAAGGILGVESDKTLEEIPPLLRAGYQPVKKFYGDTILTLFTR